MKRAVIVAALLSWGTQSMAASVPVVEVSNGATSAVAAGDLNSRVARLEQLLRSNGQSQLRLEQMVDQMQREIGELRGITETQSYQIEQMLERQRQLYQQLAKVKSTPAKAVATQASATSASTTTVSLSEADSYTAALNLATKERRFDDAIPAFRDFIKQYPKSNYTPNAYYWLGQLLYNKGEMAEAAKMFASVANQFPNSGKRADSMLKQGLIADRQGDRTAANGYFSKLIEQYPGSSAAKMAQKHIK
ncbi:tol-pal system protein YbgF [Ferrimonas lipolytica]|uniref:Cell division coordinator CpoB n=1 Tax=Ferrimonas lipolytica TaxID=2724191 RepID=A0A6H1UEY0_9GAMM|nr:tol-pal system protein YbgF [Ferrimonas lipolytica]QIZ76352.1 tol-pal system protein YbgF [Ferrimonas lipolytica]